MKKWFKTATVFALLVSVSLTFNSLPTIAAEGSEEPAAVPAASGAVLMKFVFPPLMSSEVHQQAYLTYLTEEYAPESLDQWQAAFAERKKATADMPKAPARAARIMLKQGATPEDQLKSDIAIPKLSGDSGIIELPAAGPGKFFTVETAANQEGKNIIYFNKKPGEQIDPDGKMTAEMKAAAELRAEFEKAVESGDAEAIRAVLPKVLEDYQKNTERIIQFTENIKKELDDK